MFTWSSFGFRYLNGNVKCYYFVASVVLFSFWSCGAGFSLCAGSYEPHPEEWEQVLNLASHRASPEWSADGNKIVITRGTRTIYVVEADSSRIEWISSSTASYRIDRSPDISSDGSRIVYATARHLTRCQPVTDRCNARIARNFEIETANLDGSDRKRLTENGDLDTSPVWSPDGSRIAFVKYKGLRFDGIFTMNMDGSDPQLIATTQEHTHGVLRINGGLTWSRDGTKLAYVVEEQERATNDSDGRIDYIDRGVLYVINLDASNVTRLFAASNSRIDWLGRTPAWSPDGSSIAFAYGTVDNAVELLVISSNGSNLQKLAAFKSLGFRFSVEWSPDGREILFAWGDPKDLSNAKLYVLNSDGLYRRKVAEGGIYATWSPDGSRIAVAGHHYNGKSFGLTTMKKDGSNTRVLLE